MPITAPDITPLPTTTLPQIAVTLHPETIDALSSSIASRVATLLPEPANDGWLDGYAAAEYLGIPYSTFKRHTAAGRIIGEQDTDGGRFYFKRSYLDGWRTGEYR